MIKEMDYVHVVSEKKLKGSGLRFGDHLMIIGTKVLPVKKSDPYLQRIYHVAIRVDQRKHYMPNSNGEDNGHRAYLIDPRSVEKVDEDSAAVYREMLKVEFPEDASAN